MAAALVLLAGAILPAWLLSIASAPPRTRQIHVEAYRYGFSPSRIHANRGDRLCLTFFCMPASACYAQGFGQLGEILRINPHDAAAHFCMGFAFLSMRRPEQASARFRQGLLYKPEDAEAHFGLGTALAALGRREEAASALREALRLRPDHARARDLLVRLGL